MSRPVRRLIRIAVALFALALVLFVTSILLFDTFARELLMRRIESATGMKAALTSVHIGWRSASVTIQGFRLYNTPAFGGALALDMPELRVEYDRAALRDRQLRVKLLRLNLAQVAVVQDKKGRLNFGAMDEKAGEKAAREVSSRGFVFTGIDTLDLSLGSLHFSNLATGQQSDVKFGIHHQILHDVKSEADIAAIGFILALRGGASDTNGFNLGGLLKGFVH